MDGFQAQYYVNFFGISIAIEPLIRYNRKDNRLAMRVGKFACKTVRKGDAWQYG